MPQDNKIKERTRTLTSAQKTEHRLQRCQDLLQQACAPLTYPPLGVYIGPDADPS